MGATRRWKGGRDTRHEANGPQPTEIKTVDDLTGPGAPPGVVPTDAEQSTGLERLEILGKMEGVDIFDMRPLDASRLGRAPSTPIPRGQGTDKHRNHGEPRYGALGWRRAVRRLHRCPGRLAQRHLARCRSPVHDSFVVHADPLQMSKERPIERCPECGSVYKMEYVGPADDGHHHHHHGHEDPKTFADFVKPEYRYK